MNQPTIRMTPPIRSMDQPFMPMDGFPLRGHGPEMGTALPGRPGSSCPGQGQPMPNSPGCAIPGTALPGCSSAPEGRPIAMSYVPWQQWCEPYGEQTALERGTAFSELDKPFLARRERS